MKKNFYFAFAFVLAVAISITSCKKEEEEPVEEKKSYVSISGKAFANLNSANDTMGSGTEWEEAPSGTVVIAKVNTEDYTNDPDSNVNYYNITYETTVGSDGTYSFDTITAFANEMNVQLIFSDFAYDQVVFDKIDTAGNVLTTTERKVYTAMDENVTAVVGLSKVVDKYYN